jgi:hypothetical protein
LVVEAASASAPKVAAPATVRAPASASAPKVAVPATGAGWVELALGGLAPVTAACARRLVGGRRAARAGWVSLRQVPLLGLLLPEAMGARGNLSIGNGLHAERLGNRLAGAA